MSETTQLPSIELGTVVMTRGVAAELAPEDVLVAISRHRNGDWGELCSEDWQLNDAAIVDGARVLSTYRAANGKKFWVITEWDRSVTIILLPEEY